MNKKTYIGKIYEGRWQVMKFTRKTGQYTLKNIYNNREMTVCVTMLKRIDTGESSVSSLIRKRNRLDGLNIYSW